MLIEVQYYDVCNHIHIACLGDRLDGTSGYLHLLREMEGKQHINPNIYKTGFNFIAHFLACPQYAFVFLYD